MPLSSTSSIMKMKLFQFPLHLLLLLLVNATVTITSHSLPAASQLRPMTPSTTNSTIYNLSKKLCWGCAGESIEFLVTQNIVRARKWELPLIWDPKLETYARWWAGQRSGDCRLEHSFPEDDFKLGENIFWGSGDAWRPADAVKDWADEEKYYDYGSNTCEEGEMCGHYTQIVWRNTNRVGCARVVCENGDVFMTCNYYPPGNYVGERPY